MARLLTHFRIIFLWVCGFRTPPFCLGYSSRDHPGLSWMFVALIPISDGLKHREMAHKESGEKSLPLFNVSLYRYIYIYIYIRATPGFCPGVAAYICLIHEQMMLQITVIPMRKKQVLETIKQTRSKHPKFLLEKQKRHNTCNSYGKNNKGTSKF